MGYLFWAEILIWWQSFGVIVFVVWSITWCVAKKINVSIENRCKLWNSFVAFLSFLLLPVPFHISIKVCKVDRASTFEQITHILCFTLISTWENKHKQLRLCVRRRATDPENYLNKSIINEKNRIHEQISTHRKTSKKEHQKWINCTTFGVCVNGQQ